MNELGNEFGDGNGAPREAMVEVASARAAQETQAAMVVAKKFPRNETAAYNKIMQACKRKTLAESAIYAYPRGGETIEGPSIRLAEAMAQAWGNLDFGIIELEQRNGESSIMAYAWDLETNTRQTKIFTVKHTRFTRKNGNTALSDPRDIYEMTANQGARRLRACILGVIPGDVVEAATTECERTMAGNNSEPLADRVRKALAAFVELGVNQEMIEARIGKRLDAMTETELAKMRKIYRSLKDNMASVEDFFPSAAGEQSAKTAELNARMKAPQAEAAAQLAAHDFARPEAVEPDASGADAEPPSEPAAPAMTPREQFLAQLTEAREASGIPAGAPFDNAVRRWALKAGVVGKEHTAKPAQLTSLWKAISGRDGYFAGL